MSYYLFLKDANRNDLETVDDYEMGEFDLREFWKGKPFQGSISDSVKIVLDKGDPSDYLGNPISWLIVSSKFLKLAHPFLGEFVQVIPITLYKDGSEVRRYSLLNPIGCIDAIVTSGKKRDVILEDMRLKLSMIPPDRHFFRLCHQPTTIVISQALFDAIYRKGLNGIAAFKLETI